MSGITINRLQRLYVIPSGGGFSCLGFNYSRERALKVAAWLRGRGVDCPAPTARPGSMRAYQQDSAVMAAGAAHNAATGARCDAELVPALVGRERQRVEVVDAYGERRRFIVGKSTGWLPIHLEIARRDSSGGGGVTGAPFKSIRTVAAA